MKYVKHGRSQVMPDDTSGCWASTHQLAYGAKQGRVEDVLWGADKAHNRRVPISVHAVTHGAERQRQLEAEAAASPYRTVEQDTLAAAAKDAAARAAAKPPIAQPRDAEGQA